MDKEKLFQVKEVCKICNVTRKALLIYEEKGLLTPCYVNEETGYRYYNAENLSKLLHIRKLQSFGFSLEEIGEYWSDTKKLSDVVARLTRLKEDLEETIEQLRLRMLTEDYDKQEVVLTRLPRAVCFARKKVTCRFDEALNFLRETHLLAIKTGKTDKATKMYNAVLSWEGETADLFGKCEMLYCIPMAEDYEGENALCEEATAALTLFHRGAYSLLKNSIKTLLDYAKANGYTAAGPLRLIWLEGPPIHGAKEEKYLTQLALPVKP